MAPMAGPFDVRSTSTTDEDPLIEKVQFNIKAPNELFTGRDEFIWLLHSTITENREILKEHPMNFLSQVVIVTGISGIGKTQTLREYLNRYGCLYDHMVWITMTTGYLEAFKELSQKLSSGLEKPDYVQDVYAKLCSGKQRLILVLDEAPTKGTTNNLEEVPLEDIITKLLPGTFSHPLCPPVILISSRKVFNQPDANGHPIKCLPLGQWKYYESVRYIRRANTYGKATEDDICKLVNIFGRYPSVLSLLRSVILKVGRPYIQEFIERYKSNDKSPFSQIFGGECSNIYPMAQFETLEQIESNVQENGPFAVHVLKISSSLDTASINTFLLEGLFAEEISNDPTALQSALNLLASHGCIAKNDLNGQYYICQLFQDAILQLPQSVASLKLGLVNETPLTQEEAKYLETVPCYEDEFILRDLSRRLRNLIPTLEKSNPIYPTVISIATRVASRTFNKALARGVPSPSKYTDGAVNWVDRILKGIKIKTMAETPLSDESQAALTLDAHACKVRNKLLNGIPDDKALDALRQIEVVLGPTNVDPVLAQKEEKSVLKLNKPEKSYDVRRPGCVLVINTTFENPGSRSTDDSNLANDEPEELLRRLFVDILGCTLCVAKNVSSTTLKQELADFKEVCKNSSFLIVVVMTNSRRGTWFMDDYLGIEVLPDLLHQFTDEEFPGFKGKPKIFLIEGNSMFKETKHILKYRLLSRGLADLFISLSCKLPYSMRSIAPSIYIRAITEVFSKYWTTEDLKTMHHMVEDFMRMQIDAGPPSFSSEVLPVARKISINFGRFQFPLK